MPRVVQGRVMTPEALAAAIEGESVLQAEAIVDADRDCPDCASAVVVVEYMPSVTEFVTGYSCQECDWDHADRE